MKTNVGKEGGMEKPIIKICFRNRITEDAYLFDVLSRKKGKEYPKMIGRVAVNVKTEQEILYMNTETDFSSDYKRIVSAALDSAKTIKKLLEGER